MKKIINKYLRKYIIVHSQFYDKKKDKSYLGWEIIDEIDIIFGFSHEESKLIIENWLIRRKYKDLEDFMLDKPLPDEKGIRRFQFTHFEPKRTNRWMIIFPQEYNIPTYCLKKSSRPKLNMVNGVPEWDDLIMEFNDPIGPSVTQGIMNLTYPPNLGQIEFTLEMLDPLGNTIEQWVMSGVINRVDFGEISYEKEGVMTVTINISLNRVTLVF